VALLLMTSSFGLAACNTTGQRIDRAGAEVGRAAAGVNLPDWPPLCQQDVPHAVPRIGEEMAILVDRQRRQLDIRNQNGRLCTKFYLNLQRGLATDGND